MIGKPCTCLAFIFALIFSAWPLLADERAAEALDRSETATESADIDLPYQAFQFLSDSAVFAEIGQTPEQYDHVLKLSAPPSVNVMDFLSARHDEYFGLPPGLMEGKMREIVREYFEQVVLPSQRKSAAKMQEVYQPGQRVRLLQIALQEVGPPMLLEEAIGKRLKLSTDQREKLAELTRAFKDLRAQVRRGAKTDNENESWSEFVALEKQHHRDLLAVLSAEQRADWRELQGPDYVTSQERLSQLREKAIASMRVLAERDARDGWSAPAEHDAAKLRGDLSHASIWKLRFQDKLDLTDEQFVFGKIAFKTLLDDAHAELFPWGEDLGFTEEQRRNADLENRGREVLACAKARAAVMEALSPRQRHRMFQLTLRDWGPGPGAMLRDEYRVQFGVTDEQVTRIETLKDRHSLENQRRSSQRSNERKERQWTKEDFAKANAEGLVIRQRQDQELLDVLTPEQLAAWRKLVGPLRGD